MVFEWLLLAMLVTFLVGMFAQPGSIGLKNPDYANFWAGARAGGSAYDRSVVESYLIGLADPAPRPFPYPPTFLLLVQPLRLVSYPVGYSLWVIASALALVNAARLAIARSRFADRAYPRFAVLILASPAVIQALGMGQTTVGLAALIFGGLCVIHRPVLAGAMLGLAISIKPQLGVLLPFGLLAGGYWRALWALLATGAALCIASAAAFGIEIWLGWLGSLPAFLDLNASQFRDKFLLDLPPWAKVLGLAIGVRIVWRAFRAADPAEQLIASVGTALLISPHAMWYETAIFAPAALCLVLKRDWRLFPGGAYLLLQASTASLGLMLVSLLGGAGLMSGRMNNGSRPSVRTR